jgi:hypothetical protein
LSDFQSQRSIDRAFGRVDAQTIADRRETDIRALQLGE